MLNPENTDGVLQGIGVTSLRRRLQLSALEMIVLLTRFMKCSVVGATIHVPLKRGSKMEITPDKKKLSLLVDKAYEGSLCLPNFQRDFVWSADAVADLIRSILRGYFLGSLLLLDCDSKSPPFAPISLRGAKPKTVDLTPTQLVLDGQQRLTSLLYAMYAPDLGLKGSKKPRRFFLDLELLTTNPEDDGIVFALTNKEIKKVGLDTKEGQWTLRQVPVTSLVSDAAFLKWRDGIDDWLSDNQPDEHKQFRDVWRDKWTSAVQSLLSFEIPVVTLPMVRDDDHDAVARICAIFEKLNSTGMDLSVYDLLTARLYRSKIDLHALWDEVVASNERLKKWSDGKADTNNLGVQILRTMALMRGLEPKAKVLINLAPKNFEDDWRRASAAMERALELVTYLGDDGFGVFDPKWLPGFGLLPVFAALRAHLEDRKLGGGARNDLRRWYWCSVFLERYSSSVDTRARRDYQDLTSLWSGGNSVPEVFAQADARIGSFGYTIRQSENSSSSIYSGVFCILALNGAKDWKFDEEVALQELNDHHIFPQSYLQKRGLEGKKNQSTRNTILNRTLISELTNQIIKAKAPQTYLHSRDVFPDGYAGRVEPHFITETAIAAMEGAKEESEWQEAMTAFEVFCRVREEAIIAEIRKRCGVTGHAVALQDSEELDD
jgi:hypothetical protein